MTFRLITLLAIAALAAGCQKQAEMTASCQMTPTRGLDCKVSNKGPDAGSACFDVLVKCSRGDRTAKVCSTRVEAKKAQVQTVAALEPPIELRETCYQGELRNMKVRAE
jgi:hypothetical protein